MPYDICDHPLGNNIEFHPDLRESQRFGFIWTRACVLLYRSLVPLPDVGVERVAVNLVRVFMPSVFIDRKYDLANMLFRHEGFLRIGDLY
jgi:hypothetical protein